MSRWQPHEQIQYKPVEIQEMMDDAIARLTEQSVTLDKRAKAKAEAERNYRLELTRKMEEMKSNGNPVTGLKDRAKGSQEIVDLLQKRDETKALWRASLEVAKNIREEIGVLRSLLTQLREEYKNM